MELLPSFFIQLRFAELRFTCHIGESLDPDFFTVSYFQFPYVNQFPNLCNGSGFPPSNLIQYSWLFPDPNLPLTGSPCFVDVLLRIQPGLTKANLIRISWLFLNSILTRHACRDLALVMMSINSYTWIYSF